MIFDWPITWSEFVQTWQDHHLYDPKFYTTLMIGLIILFCICGLINHSLEGLFKKHQHKYPTSINALFSLLGLLAGVGVVVILVLGIFAKNDHQVQVRNEKAKTELVIIASQRKAIQQKLEDQQTKRLVLVQKKASKQKLQTITDEIVASKQVLEANANQRQAVIAKQIRSSY